MKIECKTWNHRLLEVNVGVKLLDTGLDDFLKSDPKSNKNKQVELHQSKKFLHSKGNLPKMQPTEWEKILANHVSDKGVNIQNIFKNPYNSMCVCVLVAQSCPTLCDPMDWSPPGSFVRGILQARILEWAAISFSKKADERM